MSSVFSPPVTFRRELLIMGLRLAALERGVVLQARDLDSLKTSTQAVAAGALDATIARWGLGVALAMTWISGLDYARLAPGLLRDAPSGVARTGAARSNSTLSSSPASRHTLP
jgi:hypothetical protein